MNPCTGGLEVSLQWITLFHVSAGGDDKKTSDPVLDSFEYFHEKGKEKEGDLHKSYNDRSYLSSEETSLGESRTGKQEYPKTDEWTSYCLIVAVECD